jgi:hypothetical protein
MTDYTLNTPQANQLLSASQGILQDNCNALDERFGVDHYEFSLALPPSGYHKQVTTPDRTTHPSGATYPSIYGLNESTTNLGLLQYSKGKDRTIEGNQVSTPLTSIQSPETAITINYTTPTPTSIDIFDFTGITRCFARLTVGNMSTILNRQYITTANLWFQVNGGTPYFFIAQSGSITSLTTKTNNYILQVSNISGNAANNVYWTLEFLRIQV